MNLTVVDRSRDSLFGIKVGAHHQETGKFKHDLNDVRFHQDFFEVKIL